MSYFVVKKVASINEKADDVLVKYLDSEQDVEDYVKENPFSSYNIIKGFVFIEHLNNKGPTPIEN